ncbi:homologous-pairing protein 2-like protein [Dinothrombium tinctorium]|uniref:Homologous-pairing protein 2-like protein n=1 Tax=Dinothrombium tinctorium TaxID=1965070 RepID=A0A443QRC2_9ACAR|nr:homologous-pairing protein 2-like protein [Dinothrombium tinctorium]RWS05577.1 homologous-pairing protein 2-like protein [Dinothrombium tinctorium]RWS05840.1 homologous-pairing protein 2-like protein [Dinothrombium tinctorium]
MSKGKENANGAILKYLSSSNRPYSVTDVVNNLHKEYGKAAVTKAMEALCEEGKVCEKVNGKQKIYFVNQQIIDSVSDEKLREMDEQIVELSDKLKRCEEQLKAKQAELDSLSNELTTKQLKEQCETNEKTIVDITAKLEKFKSKDLSASRKEYEKVRQQLEKQKSVWKGRKRLAENVIDQFLEECQQSKKALLEEIGIEED